ncbi:MAG: 4-hydroxybutyrate CoA-transferase, partial [Ignavibacteriaceae bacterium]
MTTTEEIKPGFNIPFNILESYKSKVVSAEEAVQVVKPHDNVVVQCGCAVPLVLINALVKRKDELTDVKMMHVLTVGELPYLEPGMEKHFKHNAFFIGGNSRKAVSEGRADTTPIYLYEYPLLFTRGIISVDVALVHVSPPDEHGFCSYGVDVGLIKNAALKAKNIIAQINPNMPRTYGDSFIHINKINSIVEINEPIKELPQT